MRGCYAGEDYVGIVSSQILDSFLYVFFFFRKV